MPRTIKHFCNSCRQKTLHEILCSDVKNIDHTPDGEVYTSITSEMVKCRGCETVSLRVWELFSEDIDREYVVTNSYPPQTLRKVPDWTDRIDKTYKNLLIEIYIALQNKCNRLAMMGIRSLVDYFIANQIKNYKNFKDGLDQLLEIGKITKEQQDALAIVVDAGNASIHRQFNPSDEVLNLTMDTVELLLQQEALAAPLNEVKDQIPARKK
ncbi:DUF4145 domain-containing protein [Mailhella sp.]